MKFDGIKKSFILVASWTIISSIGFFNTTTAIINLNLQKDTTRGMVESLDYMDRADGFDDYRLMKKSPS